MVAMANHAFAMDHDNHLSAFILNPFGVKRDSVQVTLKSPVAEKENDFFPDALSFFSSNVCLAGGEDRKKGYSKEKNEQASTELSFDPNGANLRGEKRGSKKKKKYVEVFEKNEDEEFICPYNCPDKYSNKRGRMVGYHIQRRHDKDFNLQTFDPAKVDLDVWIPHRSKKNNRKKVADVFKKNGQGKFECPYNCPDNYAHKNGDTIVMHIKRRHDPSFKLQTFDCEKADLNRYILQKRKKYGYVFEKNEDGAFMCPYNCRHNYAHKKGQHVVQHICKMHDRDFSVQRFNRKEADLDAWISTYKTYVDVFTKNGQGEFECPYNCPDGYAHKKAKEVAAHIRARHNKKFSLKTFDPKIVDLDEYIPPKRRTGRKRKSVVDDEDKKRKKKKRKLTI